MPKRLKLLPGDVFSVELKESYGFIQFLETFDNGIEFVRVLKTIKDLESFNQKDVDLLERFCVQFPVKAAYNRILISKVGNYTIPKNFQTPKFFRTMEKIKGEFKGWYIVNRDTLQRRFTKKLKNEEIRLSPHGIYNDILLKERLLSNWSLKSWI